MLDVLSNVSFTIEAGENVGIVGKTGSGKTTVVDLILRTYNVPDGTLFLDDMDVLTAINQKLDPSILNGIKVKDGVAQGKNLASRETFDMIFNELSQTVIRVAQSMKDGAADASPLVRSGSSPCNYCKMNAICRSAQKTTY